MNLEDILNYLKKPDGKGGRRYSKAKLIIAFIVLCAILSVLTGGNHTTNPVGNTLKTPWGAEIKGKVSNAEKNDSGWFIDDLDEEYKGYKYDKTFNNYTVKYYYDTVGAFATCIVDNIKYIYLAKMWYAEKNQLSQLATMDNELKDSFK
jgi:hypothetical protein